MAFRARQAASVQASDDGGDAALNGAGDFGWLDDMSCKNGI